MVTGMSSQPGKVAGEQTGDERRVMLHSPQGKRELAVLSEMSVTHLVWSIPSWH